MIAAGEDGSGPARPQPVPCAAMAAEDQGPEPDFDAVEDLRRRRERIRAEMGGAERIEKLHAAGAKTIREHIDGLLDDGSFEEQGTFAHSENPDDAETTPGDGKVGGHGEVDGRPVTVAGDDVTVKRGSSSMIGSRRLKRLSSTPRARGTRSSTSAPPAAPGSPTRSARPGSRRYRRASSCSRAGAGSRPRA